MLQRKYLTLQRQTYWISAKLKSNADQATLLTRRASTSIRPQPTSPSPTATECVHNKGANTATRSESIIRDQNYALVQDLLANKSSSEILESVKKSPRLSAIFSHVHTLNRLVTWVAKSHTPHQSIHILKLAHDLGYTPRHKVYEETCYNLWLSKQWNSILAITHYAKHHVGSTTEKLLNWRATALMETSQFSQLGDILEEFRAAGLRPTQPTFHLLITGCIRNRDLKGLKGFLQDMQEAGFPPNSTTHAILSKSYWLFGADNQVFHSTMESLPALPPRERMVVINNLLQFSLCHRNRKDVLQILSAFSPTSVQNLVALVSPTTTGDDPTAAGHGLLDTTPDANTYALFMNYQCRSGNPESAISLWKTAAASGLSPTSNVVVALINAYFLLGRGDTVIRMIADISCPPSVKHFESLLLASSETEGYTSLDLPPSSLTIRMCNALLKATLIRQGLDIVPSIYAIMHYNGIEPNGRTAELLLSYINHTQEPHPRMLFRLARNLVPNNELSTQHMHNIFSCVLRKEKRMSVKSAWKMRNKGHPLGQERYKRVPLLEHTGTFDPFAGMGMTKHLSHDKLAWPLMQSIHHRDIKADDALSFMRMRLDAVLHLDVDTAVKVFRTMITRGLRPTAHHFCALVEGYALSGDFTSARNVMVAASEVNIKPNKFMYTTLISAHAKYQDPTSAKRVFDEMVAAGIRPDVPSIDALISAFFAVDDLPTVRRLLIELWKYVEPFPEALKDAPTAVLCKHFRTLHTYRSRGVPFDKPQRLAIYQTIGRTIGAYKKYFAQNLSTGDKDGILGISR